MKLYHNPISTCSQKVRMVLAEKRLSYDSEIIDLQAGEQFNPAYMALNPNAVVPTIEDQGCVVIESSLINEYLDDAYPEISLKPEAAIEQHRMRLWTKRIDELHASCGVVTYAIGVRPMLLQRPKADVDAMIAKIPSSARRQTRRSVVDHGVVAPEFLSAVRAHRALFTDIAKRLQAKDWLAGDNFSLADANLMPYVLRVTHVGLGKLVAEHPPLVRWFHRVQSRPAYDRAVTQLLPAPMVENFGKAANAVSTEIEKVLNQA